MKNILIVTYYYEPYNIIATRRPVSWANYLSKTNNVTVLTRSWTGQENGIKDFTIENKEKSSELINDKLEVIRVPYIRGKSKKQPGFLLKKIHGYYNHFFGKFNEVPFIKENFEQHIFTVVTERKIDLIIYTCNPYAFLNIAVRCHSKTKIPYLIDFRDLIANVMLKKNVNLKEAIYKKITALRLHFILKKSAGIITVSDPIKKIIEKFTKVKVYTIFNGFNENVFKNVLEIHENRSEFKLTYTGNVSDDMDIYPILEGISVFFSKVNPNACLYFIGVKKEDRKSIDKFNERIKIKYVDWLPYDEALQFSRNASVLISLGYRGFTGIMSGKIFDYLGLQRTIILAPSNEDALEKLIRYTNSGYLAVTANEVAVIVEKLYEEWKKDGEVKYQGNINKIMEFTRDNQAKKLNDIINTVL